MPTVFIYRRPISTREALRVSQFSSYSKILFRGFKNEHFLHFGEKAGLKLVLGFVTRSPPTPFQKRASLY